MRAGELSRGAARLTKAWDKLRLRWEATQLEWHDAVSQEFEATYLAPLEQQISATVSRMKTLAGVVNTAEHECDH